MDEIGSTLEGIVAAVMVMLVLAAVIVALAGLWLGHRRIRRGGLRRALWTINALVAINGWLALLGFLEDARFRDNPAFWMIAGLAGPALLGYAFGTSAGLFRHARSSADDQG